MYRQIVTPQNAQLLLQLPAEFIGKQVEVIAFTVEMESSDLRKLGTERHSQQERLSRLKKFISTHPIKLPDGYKFNREDIYE